MSYKIRHGNNQRFVLSLGLCMILLLFLAKASFAEVSVTYDRFKNTTTVFLLSKVKIPGAFKNLSELMLEGNYPGKNGGITEKIRLTFLIASASGWQYVHCHTVDCLVDDKPVKLPPFKHFGKVASGLRVVELIYADMNLNIIKKLSKHRKVEFRICDTEFALGELQIRDIRDFVKHFNE